MEKLLTELTNLPNIGKVLANNIISIGINSSGELLLLGAEKSFIRILAVNNGACLQQFYALEGAIKNVRWHDLPKERKKELKSFYNSLSR